MPLSRQADAILNKSELYPAEFDREPRKELFPVAKNAMLVTAQRIAGAKITVHGFRSSFSDWAIERGADARLVDLCLAHKLKDATEAAYNRTTRVDERRELMQAWADFLTGGT